MDFCIMDSEEVVVKSNEITTEEFFRKNYITFIDFETFHRQYKTSIDNQDSCLNIFKPFNLQLPQNNVIDTTIIESGVKLR